jgi:signal transduction histidine kinase
VTRSGLATVAGMTGSATWRRPPRVDVAIACGLVVLAQFDVWVFGDGGHSVGGALTMSAMAATLAWRRVAPLAVGIVATFWMFVTAIFFPLPGILTNVACLWLAFFTIGAMANRRRSVIGLAFGLVIALFMNDGSFDLNMYLAIALTSYGVPWAAGALWWRRNHARQLVAQVETSAQEAVAAERARLAREIHDVVSHNIAMIVVQAGAADVLLEDDPERSRAALHDIEEGARNALVEMRQMLHLLQPDPATELANPPRLSQVGQLVERVRGSGLPVTLSVDGNCRPLPPNVDLTAYRVVQEGLTNVLKHAGPCDAAVEVSYGEVLTVQVRDSGHGPNGQSGGFGLRGLEERLREIGGTLRTSTSEAGGFALTASFPVPEPAT